MLATSSQALWYLTRGTGVVALLLLTTSVVLGVTQVMRWAKPSWPRFLTAGLHKNVSLLVTAFLAVHIATAVIDGFAPIGWLDAVVPFRSPYRPLWLGFGALAFDLLVALVVTSLLRQRIGYRGWRIVHWTAYACWPVALLHGLGTGSDTHAVRALGAQALCLAAVAVAVWWRLSLVRDDDRRLLAGAGVLAAVAAVVAFTVVGPLRPHWSRRAGTPTTLRAATVAAAATAAPAPAAGPFRATLRGSLTEARTAATDAVTLTLTARLVQGATGDLQVVMRGIPAGGGIRLSSSSATLTVGDPNDVFRGYVFSLNDGRVVLRVTDARRQALQVALDLTINDRTGAVSGEADASAVAPSTGSGPARGSGADD